MARIIFDMDGSLFDLYSVDNWLEKLRSFNPSPYRDARPLFNQELLRQQLETLRGKGYQLIIVSWLSKESKSDYDLKVRLAKRESLAKHIGLRYFQEIHLVKYGTRKAKYKLNDNDILYDDDVNVLRNWKKAGGIIVNAKQTNIHKFLNGLIMK
jgi:phosphoglycolate phosphatase-like HAD superfamily hydrolase